ncbi:MAG TPA: tetratricopeptide repeat protein, partial [bacterium]|nr:tetratricopeptide repeat protein [bacterium]
FRQAVRLDPANFPAKFNLSYNYLKIEEFEKAMEILAELDKSFGKGKITLNSAKISNNIGYALWRTGKREEAARKFREALEASPDFSVAKKNLSSTTGRIREAA